MPRKEPKGIEGFKSSTGSYLTQALFFEKNLFEDRRGVRYTLKTYDHRGYPSLKKLYMECDDPTEYKVATTYFDGWEHWLLLCSLVWFKPLVEAWRVELSVKRASEGLERVMSEVRNESSKGSLVAAKYLLSTGWLAGEHKSTRAKAGRPPKEAVKAEAGLTDSVEQDALRVLN